MTRERTLTVTGGGADLTTGIGGWVRYQAEDLPVPVFVRLADVDGRLRPVDLFLAAEHGALDANLLRRVPLGRIEAWANDPDLHMRERLGWPGPDLRRAVSYFTMMTFRSTDKHWVARSIRAQTKGSGERQAPPRPLSEPVRTATVEIDLILSIPASRDKGDDFYSEVAELYSLVSRYTRGPAAEIAAANDVPVSTLHRWVKEARRRGLLGGGHPGKAG